VIRVAEGDTVYFHVTNLEQDIDITHGFGILNSNVDMQVEPGETKTAKWVAKSAGVTPMYCSNFCSALHQEMQGYIRVAAAGSNVVLSATTSKRSLKALAQATGGAQ